MSKMLDDAIEAAFKELFRQDGIGLNVGPASDGKVDVEGEIDLAALVKAALIGGGYLVYREPDREEG